MQFELNLYSKYRTELMGVAAIMVIASHMHDFGIEMNQYVQRFFGFGASGVEVFLFMSGFGLWRSFNNATSGTFELAQRYLFPWYKRRYLRILIPYLLFAIPIYAVISYLDGVGYAEYIRRVCFISFWNEGWGLWYVAMLFPLYFVAPFIIKLFAQKQKLLWFIIVLLLTELFVYFAFGGKGDVFFIRFISARLPSFYIGVLLAEAICTNKRISIIWVLIIPILAYMLLWTLNHSLHTRFFYLWLIPLPLATICTIILEHVKWLQRSFHFLGTLSLEVYCTHAFVPALIIRLFNLSPTIYLYLLGVCISVVISVDINRLSQKILSI